MEKKYDGFSMQEAMHLAQSDAGQQLLQLLRSNHGDAARSALEKAQNGDIAQAKQALQAFLADPQAQELLRRLKEGHNG
jgi:hypothetical protein